MTTMNGIQSTSGVTAFAMEGTPSASAIGEILPDPIETLALSGDPGAELAALSVESGEQQQKVSQTARDTEAQIEARSDQQEVTAMRQKADDIRIGGCVEGIGMMAEGGCDLAAAGDVTADGRPTPAANADKAQGTIFKATSMIGGAVFKGAEADHDADAAAAKAASDQARSAADDMHDAKKAGGDLISAALDFYREYTSSQASARSSAIHRA